MQETPRDSILVVDDTPANLELLLSMLKQTGYRVRTAPSGKLALRTAFAQPPDLVLLDIRMPNMNGYEVCKHLKADERTANIPVIFLSALDEVTDKVQAFRVGGVDFITKPFQIEEVLIRVETHLTLFRQRNEIAELHEREREHYEQMMKLKDEFVQMVSHDLRNPIGAIHGNAALLDHYKHIDQEQKDELIQNILEVSDHMERLISNLLDLTRLDQGGFLQPEPVEVGFLLKQAVQQINASAQQKEIEVSLEMLPMDAARVIEADYPMMQQVFQNLLSNAVKFTPDGGQIRVYVRAPNDETIEISVSDSGIGIPKKDLEHIFERFYRVGTAAHQERKGTGLGLAIVGEVVNHHSGTIRAQSDGKNGTTFVVSLPLLVEDNGL